MRTSLKSLAANQPLLNSLLRPRPGEVARIYLPLYGEPVPAGFPSPAQDYVEGTLDLNELCIKRPASTFMVRVSGDSMEGVGIFANDILVVDRSLEARHGDTVIATVDGEFTVKELQLRPRVRLVAHNPRYQPLELGADHELEIFGVVTSVIRNLERTS